MKKRLARLFVLSIAGACFSTLAGASSRIALSGGPVTRVAATTGQDAFGPAVIRAPERSIRPLAPGEMIILGPTAGPLSTPPPAPPVPVLAASPPPVERSVDTITVRAPAFVPEAAPSAAPGKSWESYRSGSVVHVALPRN
ncbi:MAG: hypothetical protein M3542_00960 [Acidobacteriota bacterium]|nr:hypothetical protein [Acidobacteriota bacterium]MDQ5872602.1 hypothetical protein [Acidobacteriota bacterium]